MIHNIGIRIYNIILRMCRYLYFHAAKKIAIGVSHWSINSCSFQDGSSHMLSGASTNFKSQILLQIIICVTIEYIQSQKTPIRSYFVIIITGRIIVMEYLTFNLISER